MKTTRVFAVVVGVCLVPSLVTATAQSDAGQPAGAGVQAAVSLPTLIRYGGALTDASGKPLTGTVTLSFAIYQDQGDAVPIWQETQSLPLDAQGRYAVLLGATQPGGLPVELFSAGVARWLGIEAPGAAPQPRVLLVAVPYALKAADADTLGGKPASAYMLSPSSSEASTAQASASVRGSSFSPAGNASGAAEPAPTAPVGGTGKTSFIPIWTNNTTLGNSVLFQNGTQVGVGTIGPGAELDSLGTGIAVRGTSSGKTGTGVFGSATSTTGLTAGVVGETASTTKNAAGVVGRALASSGPSSGKTIGVWGISDSALGTGVVGQSGEYGVRGTAGNDQPNTAGVLGQATAITGGFAVYGVHGMTASPANGSAGVVGSAAAQSGQAFGVKGATSSSTNYAAGVNGYAGATTGVIYGVAGGTSSATNFAAGVEGSANASTGQVDGVTGYTNSTGPYAAGVNGYEGSTTGQVFGVSGGAASATNGAAGVQGNATATSGVVYGVSGNTSSSTTNTAGVNGFASATKLSSGKTQMKCALIFWTTCQAA